MSFINIAKPRPSCEFFLTSQTCLLMLFAKIYSKHIYDSDFILQFQSFDIYSYLYFNIAPI